MNPEDEVRPQVEVAEEEYNPGKPAQDADEGNLLNFDLADFFGAEYLSLLDSTKPHLATHTTEPSVVVGSNKRIWKPTSSNHCRRTTNTITLIIYPSSSKKKASNCE